MEKIKKKSDKTQKELVKNTVELNPTITEATGKTAVIAWGRMNPVTVGHEKLVNKIREVARKEKADPHIFLSHSQDPKKNPLSYDDKVDLAKSAFGNIVYKSTAKTIIDVMKQLQGKYKNIIFVGGQDRVNDFETLLTKYNGKEYTFDSIQVVSAGERDPDADDVTGMSASKMRALALAGDEETFKKGLPTKLKTHGNDIYKLVRAGMRISEGLELEEAVLSIQQRLKRAQVMRRLEPRLKVARARAQKRLAPTTALERRSRKRAIELIRRRVAGAKGQQYGSLSASEKIQIDKLVDKRKKAIGRLAKRLLPQVRKDELIRFKHIMHGPQEKKNVNEAFETYLDEAKRYRALYRKDSTVNPNFRFKRNRKVTEDVELIGLVDELFETIANQSAKVQVALKNKADRSGIDLAFIEAVYHSASNISEQAGFDAVNAYIANWTEMHIHPHLLDPNVPLKHQISKKHIAYESVDAAFENMLAHPNCGTPNCCGQCETASITEGVNDPSIFKAVFLAGGPGSGKSFIVGKTALTSLGFKVINSDDAFERALAKAGLKTTPEDIYSDKGQEVRVGAVALTGKRMELAMNGRLGLVIDGTGKDYEKIEKQAKKLRDMGYEVAMIFVNTDLDTAKDRNRARARSLPDAEVEAMWNAVQKNIGKFQNFFSQKMYIIDNSDGSNFEGAVLGTYRKISAWAKQPSAHPKAKEWIKSQTVKEEHGAGEWGTTKLTKKYKKDAPYSSVNEAISADSKIDLQKILAMYKKTRPGDDRAAAARDRELEAYKMRVSDGMTFAQIAKELNVSIERARQIDAKAHRRFRQITNRLKEETIDEAFENMLNEEAQCALISQADIRELEKFADNLLNDYGIDIEFTRHFGDRMSDERNTPCINVKELKDFFRKVYVNKGMKIKGNRGIEAILKDLQRNLNMPVVIDYKNGEVEVTFKTIMRKKNFTSPNKSISY
jgi:nicotinic acid mononucleotide adenylyltransferase/shikimate kinase